MKPLLMAPLVWWTLGTKPPAPPPPVQPTGAVEATSPQAPETKMADVLESLEPLKDAEPFQVTLEGSTEPSFLGNQSCLYFEWGYGELGDDGSYQLYYRGYQTEVAIWVKTPKGRIQLHPGKLRLYLMPSAERTYTKAKKAEAPEVVQSVLDEHAKLVAREFTLVQGRTYYAVVSEESYKLPPKPGSTSPQRRTNLVLTLSDVPMDGHKPKLPITPAHRGRTY